MVQNWNMLENKIEKQILEKSSEVGRLLTIGYTGYMFVGGIIFSILPIAYHTYDRIWPLTNTSRTPMFILEGEYFVDRQEYFYYICLFEALIAISTVSLTCPVDSTYAVCIQQCVGLLDVVRLRLELETKPSSKFGSMGCPIRDTTYEAIVKSAELHEKVLNFGLVLESSYSSTLLYLMIGTVLILATSAVTILISLDNLVLVFRAIVVMLGFIIHMFYLCWPGQKMIDGSNVVFYSTYNNEWYNCSVRSQKLLIFIMQRSMEPFYLTAGGVTIMNFENFIMLVKSAVSYVAVIGSLTQ